MAHDHGLCVFMRRGEEKTNRAVALSSRDHHGCLPESVKVDLHINRM